MVSYIISLSICRRLVHVKTRDMANLTTGDLQTIQYQAIVDLSDTLCIGIQNDLDSIVSKMFAAGIISPEERDEILDRATNQSKPNRARSFMTLLQNKIRINPDCLASFRGILAEEACHGALVKMIGELFSISVSYKMVEPNPSENL